VKDFAPVILLAKFPLIMTVTASLPARSVADVVALAKARPGELAFASAGTGGAPHLAGELFKRAAGIDLLHVPYRGSGPAAVDVIAGRVAIIDAAPSLLPFIMSGQIRPLAAASRERHRLLPDVPTFAELGYDHMEISLWYGIAAPAATPAAVVGRLNGELVKILAMADIRKSLTEQGADIGGGTPADFVHECRAPALGRRRQRGRHQAGVRRAKRRWLGSAGGTRIRIKSPVFPEAPRKWAFAWNGT
jgi:tripartite-type tricarboxylate transporter receptor subunit TctC